MELEIIDPTGIVFNGKASKIIIPGTLGTMGILDGHEKLITPIEPGIVVVEADTGQLQYQIGTGYAHVGMNKCQILSLESVEHVNI
jgi:F0F1-type ATP synthase epsilon subunit